MRSLLAIVLWSCCCCTGYKKIPVPQRTASTTGTAFYTAAASANWQERDSMVVAQVFHGNIPQFLQRFVAIRTALHDSSSGKTYRAVYYVSPDYLSIGTNEDWARINITPYAAQKIADSLHCFLPTRKIVDAIHQQAKVKLEPVPMYAFRDSTPTMYHHHLIIEGQRKGKKGLIAGIKKDVVISGRLLRDRKDRVAIYGWHRTNGQPIQALYTGHVYWWVDYSQGIRLVYENIRVNGTWMHYTKLLQDPVLRRLICDEEYCDFNKYPY